LLPMAWKIQFPCCLSRERHFFCRSNKFSCHTPAVACIWQWWTNELSWRKTQG
jgi:hypothetical protein